MKKAIMYGAGNIGRGFIGQLFSESGYEVNFIDINEDIVNKLKNDKNYPLYITKNGKYDKNNVSNVTATLGTNIDDVANTISTADIMATAVGVNVLKYIAKPIAYGIKKRFENKNGSPLNIIICENMLNADEYLKSLVCDHLSDDQIDYLSSHVGFVEASIGRMVPATPEDIKKQNMLAVCVEEYCELPVDKHAFKGEIPYIKNLLPFEPFTFFIQRKLFIHNMSHALTAYLGKIYGYEYIYQAALDPAIKLLTLQAMLESALALSKEHNIDILNLLEHCQDLLYRFENKLLGDTSNRVGRDTVRKLSKNDRLIGAHDLCLKHKISPVYICLGIASALCFDADGDIEVAQSVKETGVKNTLKKYSGLENEHSLFLIETLYDMLKSNAKINTIISYLEKEKLNKGF